MSGYDEMVGASRSLNLTITDILEYLGEDGSDRPGPYEDKRAYLYNKISDLMIRRYKNGFKRGHQSSFDAFNETGEVPRKLAYNCARRVLGGKKRPVRCSSTVKANG